MPWRDNCLSRDGRTRSRTGSASPARTCGPLVRPESWLSLAGYRGRHGRYPSGRFKELILDKPRHAGPDGACRRGNAARCESWIAIRRGGTAGKKAPGGACLPEPGRGPRQAAKRDAKFPQLAQPISQPVAETANRPKQLAARQIWLTNYNACLRGTLSLHGQQVPALLPQMLRSRLGLTQPQRVLG